MIRIDVGVNSLIGNLILDLVVNVIRVTRVVVLEGGIDETVVWVIIWILHWVADVALVIWVESNGRVASPTHIRCGF